MDSGTEHVVSAHLPGRFVRHRSVSPPRGPCGVHNPENAADLLQGRQFRDLAIGGLIEGDFFDWVLKDDEASRLVTRLDDHVRRFRIERVELDVLKIVYESLIDPAQRHDLGEYYTPDWLADWICARHVDHPASQKVLDPACGSGSFLFHAVRRHVAAARAAGVPESELAGSAAETVFGLDVHPVAVLVARVTYLLALGPDLLAQRSTAVDIPVYLGDALLWSVRGGDLFGDTLEIQVPRSGGHGEAVLRFPVSVCRAPALFDDVLRIMLEDGDAGRPREAFLEQLAQDGRVAADDRAVLGDAYATLARLQAEGRDHVWGYVARNLSRPLWLSQTVVFDRVVGNPPWLSLRYMEGGLQQRVRDAMKAANLWVGGQHATHQDLSLLFFERAARFFLRRGGRIAFVMPLAAMTRGYAEKFRTGAFPQGKVRFLEAWTFDDRVFPLFPVPSCVLFAEREAPARGIPDTVTGFAGLLPDRNASAEVAGRRLRRAQEAAPAVATFQATTPYRSAFRQGATLVPRMLCYVVRREAPLGGPRVSVESRRSNQEKEPWKSLPSLRGAVEREFIRPALLARISHEGRCIGV